MLVLGIATGTLILVIYYLMFILIYQLDDVQLTTQASMQRLHSLFNNMNGATKKRAQAKTEADNVSMEQL